VIGTLTYQRPREIAEAFEPSDGFGVAVLCCPIPRKMKIGQTRSFVEQHSRGMEEVAFEPSSQEWDRRGVSQKKSTPRWTTFPGTIGFVVDVCVGPTSFRLHESTTALFGRLCVRGSLAWYQKMKDGVTSGGNGMTRTA